MMPSAVQDEGPVDHPSSSRIKYFNDPIHGHIPLGGECLKVIDTSEFQRLRYIKQLGACHFVFPSANHTRFEHSLGTCHLAEEVVCTLKQKQPELEITQDDITAVSLAGLCHDIGHGCFSHVLDNEIFPEFVKNFNWTHERRSTELIDYLVEENSIDIDRDIISTAQSLILSDMSLATRDMSGKHFLWDIVANERSGIDVDKFDYLVRDSYFCNVKSSFEHERVINTMRVVDDEICFKYREADTVYDLFNVRSRMHRHVYTHKTVKALEYMILDALKAANHVLKFEQFVNDLPKFCKLDDTLLRQLVNSEDPSLEQTRGILKRIDTRQLYRYVAEFVVPASHTETFRPFTVDELIQHQAPLAHLEEFREDIIVHNLKIDYGQGMENPVDKVHFYEPRFPKSKFKIKGEQVSNMIPQNYKDLTVRLFIRNRNDALERHVLEAFSSYQVDMFGKEVMRTPSRKRQRNHYRGSDENEGDDDFDDVVCSQTSRKLL